MLSTILYSQLCGYGDCSGKKVCKSQAIISSKILGVLKYTQSI